MFSEKTNFRISITYNIPMYFWTKQYYLLFIYTHIYRTMVKNKHLHMKCIMITSVWKINKIGKRSEKGFQLYNVLFILFKNMRVQFSSVAQSCLTLSDRMDCSIPGLPIHHQLPELAQTHVHQVSDATQPSHLLSFPSPPAFRLSHHQGLFQWVSSSHQVPKLLAFSFSISPSNEYSRLISYKMDWLDLLAVQGTLKSIRQQFFGINSSAFTFCYSPTFTYILDYWENHSFD